MFYNLLHKNKSTLRMEALNSKKAFIHWKTDSTLTSEEIENFNSVPLINETTGETLFVSIKEVGAVKTVCYVKPDSRGNVKLKTSHLENDANFVTKDEMNSGIEGANKFTSSDLYLRIVDQDITANIAGLEEEFDRNITAFPIEVTTFFQYTSFDLIFIDGIKVLKKDYTVLSDSKIIIERAPRYFTNGNNTIEIKGTHFITENL